MYDRTVNDQKLTFCVSGKLWNRSLVMLDNQTESLWSHILGRAMEGKLKGTLLETIPADMVTWEAWRQTYPETSVLNMSRTNRQYSKEFYEKPDRFVIGFKGKRGMHHCSFATLKEIPLVNADAGGLPLLVTFDADSTSALVFHRKLGEQILDFTRSEDGSLQDEQTNSTWDRRTGRAITGKLKGKQLVAHLGIVSFTRAWKTFHPKSHGVSAGR